MKISPKVFPLRFWSNKVLPLVYDDSLSYYEVLSKVVAKLNEVIKYVTTTLYDSISELIQQYFVDIVYNEANEEIILKVGDDDE